MSTDSTNPDTASSEAEALCEYIPCFYEKFFRVFEKDKELSVYKLWRRRVFLIAGLYAAILAVFFFFVKFFSDRTVDPVPYTRTSFVLATVLCWPLIVAYDSELFYKTGSRIIGLFETPSDHFSWYEDSAERFFRLRASCEPFAAFPVFISFICCAASIAVYFLRTCVPGLIPSVTGNPVALIICVTVSALTFILQDNSRNLLVILFTVCCGTSYYICILYYFPSGLLPLFDSSFIPGHILIMFLVCLVFFIAGTTLLPMVGLIRTFYLSGFEKYIHYPIAELAASLDDIQRIKRYYIHLTGINLMAYFQLLGSVYLLGLLDSPGSLLTKALFIGGSFFPISMYLATNLFFKRLCQKIYMLQVKDIDNELYGALSDEDRDKNAEYLQALVEVRTMYTDEFEIHTELNKEVLVAMFTPIITAVAAILIP